MSSKIIGNKNDNLITKKEVTYEDEYVEDPREELIERLIEYRKYKEIAYELKDKELNDKQVYTRSPIVFKDILNEPQVTKGNISIFEMVSAIETDFIRHKSHQLL